MKPRAQPKPAPTPAQILKHDSRLFTQRYFVAMCRRLDIEEAKALAMFAGAIEKEQIMYACHVRLNEGVAAYFLNS